MIDVKKNIICFGYGDVMVNSGCGSTITFTGFKPPVEVGTVITGEVIKDKNIECITEPVKITFTTMKELKQFKKLVEEIDGEDHVCFEYRNYTFDFSNYNENSIKVLLTHIEKAAIHFLLLMAC